MKYSQVFIATIFIKSLQSIFIYIYTMHNFDNFFKSISYLYVWNIHDHILTGSAHTLDKWLKVNIN